MPKSIIVFFLLLIPILPVSAFRFVNKIAVLQQNINVIQPVIIVIPRIKAGEDIRTILDNNFNKRIAVSKVKEAFDSKYFTTKSFETTLKIALDNDLFTSNSQDDIKTKIIELSAADIYVEVDVSALSKTEGGNNLNIILEGSDCSTGASFANKSCTSGYFYTTDTTALLGRALDKCKDEFINILQTKFNEVAIHGRTFNISFKLARNAALKFDDEIEGTPLADLIEAWIADNAFNNNYTSKGATKLALFYEVKVPLKDDKGKTITAQNYALKIYNLLKSKNVLCSKEIKNGIIYLTIK